MTSKIVQFNIEAGRITLLYANGSLWRGTLNVHRGEVNTVDWKQIYGPLDEMELQNELDPEEVS